MFLATGLVRAAVLKGVVLDNLTGRPLARARVSVQQLTAQSSPNTSSSMFSDSYGRFEFQVGEGEYILSASKRSYAPARFGQQTWKLGGTTITLGADALFVAEMRMKRLGVITGEVWDENHLGIPNIRVTAYRSAKVLRAAATGESDDRGVFRIFGLTPGKYVVRTMPKELEAERGLLPTFYGQTTRRDGALLCDVRLEQDVAGINIEPAAGRVSTLSITPQAPANMMVTVSLQTEFGLKTARVPGGEPATFTELPPGNYEAFAEGIRPGVPPPDNRLTGYTRVTVGKPTDAAMIHMTAWPKFPVACRTDDRIDLSSRITSIAAIRTVPDDSLHVALTCSNLNSMPYGVYTIQPAVPAGMYLEGVVAGKASADKPMTLDFTRGYFSSVDVVFGARPGSVRGVVKSNQGIPAAGAPVILRALDESVQANLRSAPWTTTGADGRFSFTAIPPGQYEVISSFQLSEPEEGEWDYPSGKSVLVEPGKSDDVEIGVTDIPGVQ